MRLLIIPLLVLSTTSALAATADTPAGKINLPPQPSRQYLPATPTQPADPDVSWGKADVSYADYKQDALYCTAYAMVYAMNAPAWALTHDEDVGDVIEMRYQTSDYAKIGRRDEERCLTMRGYVRFHLTPEETKHLSALPPGSDGRREYLYSLGSDAKVLSTQAFPDR